jgi:hypothetical protein
VESSAQPPVEVRGRRLVAATLGTFVCALGLLLWLYAPSPLLHDTDAYYHLGVAREYAERGVVDELRWVRFGLLSEHFGDKEILFHLLLMPFSDSGEANWGGRLALALLGALNLTLIAFLAMRAVGLWGLVVPLWLILGSAEVAWRLVRLRPELLSLAILLLALWAAGRGRWRWLGVLGFLYALSYTAVHAFVGLFAILSVVLGWIERRWQPALLLYPCLGVGLGLLVHPHFPENLVVWWSVAVEFFLFKGALDVGTEIRPNFTDVVLMVNLGWFAGAVTLWRSAVPAAESPERDRMAESFAVATAVFGILYLLMSRFSLYFFPFASLWLLFEIRRRGWRIGGRTRLPWRGQVPAGVAWLGCLVLALPIAAGELGRFRARTELGPEAIRLTDRRDFAKAVPEDARVAAPWGDTPIYLYWAPQGRYLNVLEPMLLAAYDPDAHAVQQAVFSGSEPDVPLALATGLDSDFLAYPAMTESPGLTARLEEDPRATALHRGINALYRLRPAPETFVLDWKLVPATAGVPPPAGSAVESWVDYPRLGGAPGALEGYVDVRRTGIRDGCVALLHRLQSSDEEAQSFELAPYGPSAVWLDGRLLARVDADLEAVLGRGIVLPIERSPGERRLTVLTCPDRATGKHTGFYLRRLDPTPPI